MSLDFTAFLEHLRSGMSQDDAAALCDVLPSELDDELALIPDAVRQVAKAEAEFRLLMTQVLVTTAQVNRSVTAARHFLQRPGRDKQLPLDFRGVVPTATLDVPDNGRERS